MAVLYTRLGQIDEAMALYEQAEAVDPMGALWPSNLVEIYTMVGRFVDAENAARRAYELNGNDQMYRSNQSFVYTIQGRHEDALEVLDLLLHQSGDLPKGLVAESYMQQAVALYGLGRYQEAQEVAIKLDALDDTYETLHFAAIYSFQGDLDEAFVWLEKAAKEFPRDFVERDPRLKEMRNDPRWQPVLEQFEDRYENSGQ